MSATSLAFALALQIDEDRRDAGTREAAQEIEVRRLLQLALEPLGDLFDGLLDGCAGPGGLNHHRLDDEGRVFAAAETEIGKNPGDNRNDHEVGDERTVLERPFRKIESGHCSDPSRRIFWPGCSACTPAVTTISPVSSPCDTTTRS